MQSIKQSAFCIETNLDHSARFNDLRVRAFLLHSESMYAVPNLHGMSKKIDASTDHTFTTPDAIRPWTNRPKYRSCEIMDTGILNSVVVSAVGGGMCEMMQSSNGPMPLSLLSSLFATHHPCLPEAYMKGKSSCSSVAFKSTNRSKISFSTSVTLLESRSTLLMTTIGLRPLSRAFDKTNFVCVIGPSVASTRSRTPSTILSTRSTSPPKSAWPGVSTMFRRTPFQFTAVTLLRIVTPELSIRGISATKQMHLSLFPVPCCPSLALCLRSRRIVAIICQQELFFLRVW